MIVVASTFSNNSLSELHMNYFSRTSFRLQHSSSICLTVREHLHLSQSGWLSPESRYLWVTRVLHPASGCYRSCADYKFSDNSGYDCQTGVSTTARMDGWSSVLRPRQHNRLYWRRVFRGQKTQANYSETEIESERARPVVDKRIQRSLNHRRPPARCTVSWGIQRLHCTSMSPLKRVLTKNLNCPVMANLSIWHHYQSLLNSVYVCVLCQRHSLAGERGHTSQL